MRLTDHFAPTDFPKLPTAASYQQIPEDLFVLVRHKKINHDEFVILAVFHKESDYHKKPSVVLSHGNIADRTGLSLRTTGRRLANLVKKLKLVEATNSTVVVKGYAVREYVVRWRKIQELAAPLRQAAKDIVANSKRQRST